MQQNVQTAKTITQPHVVMQVLILNVLTLVPDGSCDGHVEQRVDHGVPQHRVVHWACRDE